MVASCFAVTHEGLLVEARAWRTRAAAVLAASELLELLGDRGRVVLSGSYAYDTMMSPDIDLHVLPPAFSRPDAVEVLDALVRHDWWNTYDFGDYVQERFRAPLGGHLPRGYLVKLGRMFEGISWNVDAWLLDPAKYPGDFWTPRMAAITPDQRLAVLRIKKARAERQLNGSGVEIYSAVLDHHVTTPEEFTAWQADGPSRATSRRPR